MKNTFDASQRPILVTSVAPKRLPVQSHCESLPKAADGDDPFSPS